MNDITIIGLGVIGAALAQTLLKNGYKVTVWNRSPEKAEALKKEGAIVAMSSAEAIAANPTVLICIKTHTDTRAILESAQSLEGKNIIELSTGSAPEAESLYQWINEKKAECLIGMICTFPRGIGEKDSTILTEGVLRALVTCFQTIKWRPHPWVVLLGLCARQGGIVIHDWLTSRLTHPGPDRHLALRHWHPWIDGIRQAQIPIRRLAVKYRHSTPGHSRWNIHQTFVDSAYRKWEQQKAILLQQ